MAETSDKRAPGRPAGLPKTGGRKPGSKNRVPAELRQFVDQRGRPLEFLAAIARGAKVTAADPEDPGQKTRLYPTLAERVTAARVLLDRIMPTLKAVELSADAAPEAEPISKFDLARMIAFSLSEGIEAKKATAAALVEHEWPAPDAIEPILPLAKDAPEAENRDALTETTVEPDPAKEASAPEEHLPGGLASDVDREETFCGHILRFEEHLSGGRERWSIRDAQGRFLAVAVGRDRAQAKALEIGGTS